MSQAQPLTSSSSTLTIVSGQPLGPSGSLPTSVTPRPVGQRITVSLLSFGLRSLLSLM